jgi:hypothetical protein
MHLLESAWLTNKRFKVLRTSENNDQKTVIRKDGAVVCNAKTPKGRCRKLVATATGKAYCDNHHMVSWQEIQTTFVQNLAQGGYNEGYELLAALTPKPEAVKSVIDRIATYANEEYVSRFGNSPSTWLFHCVKAHRGVFSYLLNEADSTNRQAADFLRQIWRMVVWDLDSDIVRKALFAMREEDNPYKNVFQEKAIQAWIRCGERNPYAQTVWAQIELEAAQITHDGDLPLYEHNANEAMRWLQGQEPLPVYFLRDSGTYSLHFLIDPWWELRSLWKDTSQNDQLFVSFTTARQSYWTFPEEVMVIGGGVVYKPWFKEAEKVLGKTSEQLPPEYASESGMPHLRYGILHGRLYPESLQELKKLPFLKQFLFVACDIRARLRPIQNKLLTMSSE